MAVHHSLVRMFRMNGVYLHSPIRFHGMHGTTVALFCCNIQYLNSIDVSYYLLVQGCTNPGRQVTRAIKC